jgi:hypothetical protein
MQETQMTAMNGEQTNGEVKDAGRMPFDNSGQAGSTIGNESGEPR